MAPSQFASNDCGFSTSAIEHTTQLSAQNGRALIRLGDPVFDSARTDRGIELARLATAPCLNPNLGLVQRQAMAGDKLWVAGVELAQPASPRRRRRTRGRRPPVADPSHPALLPAFEPGPNLLRMSELSR